MAASQLDAEAGRLTSVITSGGEVRQWMCVPPQVAVSSGMPAQQDFHVLLETKRGRLVWFVVNQRHVPESALLCAVARRMDSFTEAPVFEKLRWDLRRQEKLNLTFLDGLVTDETAWGLDLWSRRDIGVAAFDNQFSDLSAGEIRDTIILRNKSWLQERRGVFVQNLAPDVTAVIGALRPYVYNYLSNECPVRRRNRLQALNLFPIFSTVLFEPRFASIIRIIDAGEPLIDAVADTFTVGRPVVRAIRGHDVLAARSVADNLPMMLQVLRDIPSDWLPRNTTEWGRFADTVRHVEKLSRAPGATTNNRLILRECAGRGFRPTDVDSDEWWRVGQEIDELTVAIREAIRHQLSRAGASGNHDAMARRQVDRMLLDLGIKRFGRIARRWGDAHRRAQTAFEAQHAVMEEMLWPLLVSEPIPVADLVAHHLPNAEALTAEGRAMSNCVSTYVHACITGRCQIWSIRTVDDVRVSNLETSITRGEGGAAVIHLGQHAGSRNTKPLAHAVRAAQDLKRQMATKPDAMARYLKWKETTAKIPLSERRLAASIGVIITALDEVLPERWRFEVLSSPTD